MDRPSILIPPETLTRAAAYLQALATGTARPGGLLRARLGGRDLTALASHDLLGLLFDTKPPQIFAESAVAGDGSDWTLVELGLLGDVSVAVPVTVFDDGQHHHPRVHDAPFKGMLVFTPGALLRNGRGVAPADWEEVVGPDDELSVEGYYQLYRRRLLPVLRYVNDHARQPRSAVLTIPGLGCGQFAGRFQGRLGSQLQGALQRLLMEHGAALPNLACVHYDPYDECRNEDHRLHGIAFRVRPLRAGGGSAQPQLCTPTSYAEAGEDFSGCGLYSIVAWDHVSWPGNDFYGGARATDDGVKAAATDAMAVLTGVAGQYDAARGMYLPPAPHRTWGAVVREAMRTHGLRLWNPELIW